MLSSPLLALLCLVASLCVVHADIYLHTPRGSNNRLDERNRERHNGDRLFDSQNNKRGGYNVGNIYYYTGSVVSIEWTAQHSCGDPTRQTCELVIQYTCDDRLRDGTTTTTIPKNPNQCYNYDCDTDVRFGRHESFASYRSCERTTRNKGLFTASQNLNGDSQRFTRQNPGGTRRGYECPEERDYYPYWQPTVWRDIAVLTNNPSRCDAYRAESQNVISKYWCWLPSVYHAAMQKTGKTAYVPITQSKCEAITYYDAPSNTTYYGVWKEQPAWGMDPPECRENHWSRDNHHGNVIGTGGFMANFNWTIPKNLVHERCALRLRYNISNGDLIENWADDYSIQVSPLADFTENAKPNPTANRDPAKMDVWSRFKLNYTDVAASFGPNNDPLNTALRASREYVMKNNPRVDPFGPLLGGGKAQSFLKFQLAINTAQYGRTFQDRSHRFALRTRPSDIPSDAVIHNLQVRGKRGNIVQVYPGVEYDFSPNRLEIQSGDYIHFQWTGSNTNPHNNAGQGLEGTDRSNIVAIREKPFDDEQVTTDPPTKGSFGGSYPSRVDDPIAFLGLSRQDQIYLALLSVPGGQFGGHMDELDDAGTYFDLGPRKITQLGIYHYLCTRNNNFSNRSQQGKIVVRASAAASAAIGSQGGKVMTAGGQVITVKKAAFSGLQTVTAEALPRSTQIPSSPSNKASDFMGVYFDASGVATGKSITFTMNYDNSPLHTYSIYQSSDISVPNPVWKSAAASFSGGQATVTTSTPGTFVITSELEAGAIAGIVIGSVVFIGIVTLIVWKVYKRNAGVKMPSSPKESGISMSPSV